METIELRSLLCGRNKKVIISEEIAESFRIWKEKRAGEEINELEIFYAGYVLSNPVVRELYKKDKKKK